MYAGRLELFVRLADQAAMFAPIDISLFARFGVALLIGFLIGMQREFSYIKPEEEHPAGIRTFALMAMLGCAGAFASTILNSPWPYVALLLVVAAFFAVTHYVASLHGQTGLTTEISAIITLLCGALAYWNQIILAVALGVTTTVLLSFKLEMHGFVRRITREDLYATLKFAVITAIILPILPNRTFGPPPFNVINPFTVWLLVIFISGISFIGYVLMKIIGVHRGMGLTGLLGGIASSTAVTLSLTRTSRGNPGLSKPFALAILLAWTVMFARVLILVMALNWNLARIIFLPIIVPILAGLAYCLYLVRAKRPIDKAELQVVNPFELWPAFTFALLFTTVLLLTKTAQMYLGIQGVYLTSFLSGLADVDAIALSMSTLSRAQGGIDLTQAGRAVLLATLANTLLKGLLVVGMGSAGLRRTIIPGFLCMAAASLAVIFVI